MEHRLKEIRKSLKLSQTEMAEVMEITLRGYQYIEKGERGLDMKYIKTAAKKLSIPEKSFFVETNSIELSYVKVIGEAQAGNWKEAIQWDEQDTFDVPYGVPAQYQGKVHGLRIAGDSMNLAYPPGTVVIVVPIWSYDGAITSGKRVIVERCKKDATCEATAKEIEINNGHAKLWPRSTNPKYQQAIDISWPYETPQEIGLETVEIKGVIIGSFRSEE